MSSKNQHRSIYWFTPLIAGSFCALGYRVSERLISSQISLHNEPGNQQLFENKQFPGKTLKDLNLDHQKKINSLRKQEALLAAEKKAQQEALLAAEKKAQQEALLAAEKKAQQEALLAAERKAQQEALLAIQKSSELQKRISTAIQETQKKQLQAALQSLERSENPTQIVGDSNHNSSVQLEPTSKNIIELFKALPNP